ncbi:MAG: histidinol-phosphate aminotransferase, partial [Cyanobacteria bacterium P01_D01_bin.116]
FIFIRLKAKDNKQINNSLKNLHKQLQNSGTLIRLTGGGLRITVGSPSENARTLNRFDIAFKNIEF